MDIIEGCLFDFNVYEAILISTHNIHFMIKCEKFSDISINICFLDLSREFPRNSKMS